MATSLFAKKESTLAADSQTGDGGCQTSTSKTRLNFDSMKESFLKEFTLAAKSQIGDDSHQACTSQNRPDYKAIFETFQKKNELTCAALTKKFPPLAAESQTGDCSSQADTAQAQSNHIPMFMSPLKRPKKTEPTCVTESQNCDGSCENENVQEEISLLYDNIENSKPGSISKFDYMVTIEDVKNTNSCLRKMVACKCHVCPTWSKIVTVYVNPKNISPSAEGIREQIDSVVHTKTEKIPTKLRQIYRILFEAECTPREVKVELIIVRDLPGIETLKVKYEKYTKLHCSQKVIPIYKLHQLITKNHGIGRKKRSSTCGTPNCDGRTCQVGLLLAHMACSKILKKFFPVKRCGTKSQNCDGSCEDEVVQEEILLLYDNIPSPKPNFDYMVMISDKSMTYSCLKKIKCCGCNLCRTWSKIVNVYVRPLDVSARSEVDEDEIKEQIDYFVNTATTTLPIKLKEVKSILYEFGCESKLELILVQGLPPIEILQLKYEIYTKNHCSQKVVSHSEVFEALRTHRPLRRAVDGAIPKTLQHQQDPKKPRV